MPQRKKDKTWFLVLLSEDKTLNKVDREKREDVTHIPRDVVVSLLQLLVLKVSIPGVQGADTVSSDFMYLLFLVDLNGLKLEVNNL